MSTDQGTMRVIAVEEHFLDPTVLAATAAASNELSPDFFAAFVETGDFPSPDVAQGLGDRRLADMDATGVTMQVLSCPGGQLLPASNGVEVARGVNDRAADAIRRHPDRFAAIATLPTVLPDEAAAELTRCVTELGFGGALITGRTEGEFLDAPRFEPILETASRLGVPLYLHPAVPPRVITEANYAAGLSPIVTARLQTSAWGWHQETAAHFLHLAMSGVFDRYPTLQVVLGHWGETIPFFLDRITTELPARVTKLDREFSEYIHDNVYVSPSGMFSQAQLRYCLETLSIDRILFSVDYPIEPMGSPAGFLADAELSDEDKHKIAHVNAERLFGIAPAVSTTQSDDREVHDV
jgi:predicted TIM-barrel fold metal-dependent hydrolase